MAIEKLGAGRKAKIIQSNDNTWRFEDNYRHNDGKGIIIPLKENDVKVRGIGAVGSAPHWQCGGHGFKSRMLHYFFVWKRFKSAGHYTAGDLPEGRESRIF